MTGRFCIGRYGAGSAAKGKLTTGGRRVARPPPDSLSVKNLSQLIGARAEQQSDREKDDVGGPRRDQGREVLRFAERF